MLLEIERKSNERGSHELTIGSLIIRHDGDSSAFNKYLFLFQEEYKVSTVNGEQ